MAGFADMLKSAVDSALKNPLGALNTVNLAADVLKNAATHPDAALSAFLLSFAKAIGHELSPLEATTLARMVVRVIKRGKRV